MYIYIYIFMCPVISVFSEVWLLSRKVFGCSYDVKDISVWYTIDFSMIFYFDVNISGLETSRVGKWYDKTLSNLII